MYCICVCVCLCVRACACVKVQEVQSSRSPPPTSTTEQKTRPPPLHTRYPLVSTSIEDLFYRSLVQTRSRTRSMRGQHYFRLIYGSGRFYGPARARAPRLAEPTRRAAADSSTRARRREKECKVRGSSRISSLSRFAPLSVVRRVKATRCNITRLLMRKVNAVAASFGRTDGFDLLEVSTVTA